MESPNAFMALGYYIVSSFLDPVQWLICGLCGWKMERIDQAMIAGAAMVGLLLIIMIYLYPDVKTVLLSVAPRGDHHPRKVRRRRPDVGADLPAQAAANEQEKKLIGSLVR